MSDSENLPGGGAPAGAGAHTGSMGPGGSAAPHAPDTVGRTQVRPGGGWPWRFWASQALAVCRLDLRRTLFSRRAFPIYFLAMLPVVPFALRLLLPLSRMETAQGTGFATMLYAAVFQSFILRFVVYFGCVGVFMNLFRGEVLDRSLHYYFLSPLRREVLVAGKYLAGLTTTSLLFMGSTALSFILLYAPQGGRVLREQLLGGPGLGHLFAYLLVVLLACVGYGAVFLLMGLLFRNPVIPALTIMGWELIIPFLPPLLKKISVIYYLQSLCPVQLSGGQIEIMAEPSPPSIAIPGIFAVTVLLLVIAGLCIRRMEVKYASD